MVLAPDHGIGVLTFSNTGAFNPRGAPVPVANALLDLPEDAVRAAGVERSGVGEREDTDPSSGANTMSERKPFQIPS